MSKETAPKVVKIKENDLVNLIENIVNEAVSTKKNEWIAENKQKNKKTLEETITKIVESKLAAKKK